MKKITATSLLVVSILTISNADAQVQLNMACPPGGGGGCIGPRVSAPDSGVSSGAPCARPASNSNYSLTRSYPPGTTNLPQLKPNQYYNPGNDHWTCLYTMKNQQQNSGNSQGIANFLGVKVPTIPQAQGLSK
jgi:hypothetical protein